MKETLNHYFTLLTLIYIGSIFEIRTVCMCVLEELIREVMVLKKQNHELTPNYKYKNKIIINGGITNEGEGFCCTDENDVGY